MGCLNTCNSSNTEINIHEIHRENLVIQSNNQAAQSPLDQGEFDDKVLDHPIRKGNKNSGKTEDSSSKHPEVIFYSNHTSDNDSIDFVHNVLGDDDNQNNQMNNEIKKEQHNIFSDFSEELLKEINFARTKPIEYSVKLKEAMKFIKPNERKENPAFLFQMPGSDKVGMANGSKAFEKAVDYLLLMQPLRKLRMCEKIKIDTSSLNGCFNNKGLKTIITNMRKRLKDEFPFLSVNIDIMTDPKLSTMMQIVDDNLFQGDRRSLIFNKKFSLFACTQVTDEKNNLFSLISFA